MGATIPHPGPCARYRTPGTQASRKPEAQAAAGDSRALAARVPDFAPAPSLRLLPSSRSRKRPGHIGPLQIRRCPNKGCSGGDPSCSLYGVSGSLPAAAWLSHKSLVPSREPERTPKRGTTRQGGLRRGALGAPCVAQAAPRRGLDWGNPALGGGEGESGRGSAAVIQCPPAHLWDRGSGEGAKGRSGWVGRGRGRPGEAGP